MHCTFCWKTETYQYVLARIKMKISTSIEKIKNWKDRHVSDKSFILLASTLVGLTAGLAAVLLKISVHFIHHQLNSEKYNENYGRG